MMLSSIKVDGYLNIAGNAVYQANEQSINNRDISELKKLDDSIDSIVNDTFKVNFDDNMFKNKVYFKDAKSGTFIKIGLSDENIAKLKDKFGLADFYTRNDGSAILSGRAESFVAGWFSDIAYKRGYINADENNNGEMSKSELAKTFSGFSSHGVYSFSTNTAKNLTTSSYERLDSEFTAKHKTLMKTDKYASSSIEAELNKTINNDKNANGIISYREIMSSKEAAADTADLVGYATGGGIGDFGANDEDLLEETPEQKALKQMLMGGVGSLNAEQKALLAKAGLLIDENTQDLSSVIKNIEANIKNSKIDLKA